MLANIPFHPFRRRPRLLRWVLAVLAVASAQALAVQQPPIETDRPDQTELPFLVPVRRVQVETGHAAWSASTASNEQRATSVLVRYGASERLELRADLEWASMRLPGGGVRSGLTPVALGWKVPIAEEQGALPAIALIGHLTLPSASARTYRTTYSAPSFRFAMQHTLGGGVSVGYNMGAEWDGVSAEPAFLYTLTGGFALTGATGCFAEVYGSAPQGGNAEHRVDGGFIILLKPNVLADVSAGYGITRNAAGSFIGAGLSFRLMD